MTTAFASLKNWSASMWLTLVGVLLLGTGVDAVLYQSILRPLGAEVRFFAVILPAGSVLLALSMGLHLLQERWKKMTMPSLPQVGLLLLAMGFMTAFATAQDLWLHGGGILGWIFWMLCFWFYSLSEKHRRVLMIGLVISAGVTSMLALLQVLHQGGLGLSTLGEPALSLTTPGTSKITIAGLTLLRGYGLFPHPNIAFGWMVMGLWAFFSLFPRWKPWERPELTLIVGFLALGLLATGSKSVLLLGIALAFTLWIAAKKNARAPWMGLGIALVALSALLLWFLWPSETVTDRLFFLDAAWKLFVAHPLGMGLSHTAAAIHAAGEARPWMLQPVHTVYGLLFLETGLIGGLGWLFLCISMGTLALKNLFKHHVSWPSAAVLGYILLSSFFDHFWLTYPATFLALAWLFADILAPHLARGTGRSYNKG